MTAIEKLSRIEAILKVTMMTYKEADELAELRKALKVSDFFLWLREVKQEFRCSPDYFYKVMGTNTKELGYKGNIKLEKAIDLGFVERYEVRKYSQYFYYIELTERGKALLRNK